MNKKNNLIFLWNYLEWGGAQIYILSIIKEAQKDWNIKVILPEKSSSELLAFFDELDVKYEFIKTHIENSPAHGIIKKLKRQWRRIHAEIISFFVLLKYPPKKTVFHIEIAPWQSWIFLSLLALRGNVFVTVHNALLKTSKWRETVWKLRLKFLSKLGGFHIFTANEQAKQSLKLFVSKSFYDNIKVTYASINPLETENILKKTIDKSIILKRLNLPCEKFIVLCVGQFIDRKGRWVFLEAAETLLKKHSDIIFVWLMQQLPDDETLSKISNYQLNGAFHPLLSSRVGKSRHQILEFFTIADLFVLPSYLEGLPISLLEAMALKKACISTRINGIPEAVKHLETGWLIEPDASGELVNAIQTLKKDDNLRKILIENAHQFVIDNFDERKMAESAINEYENCLK